MPSLPGPRGPIAYERDALGYPSVRARDIHEGTYALGYLHASDRLVQITLAGLASRGDLMQALGDVPFARLLSYSVRAFGLARGLGEQAARVDAPSRSLLEVYAQGFQRALEGRRRPVLLRLLGVAPFACGVEDLIALFRLITYFGLTSMQLSAELTLADFAGRGAPLRLFQRALGDRVHGLDLESLRGLELPRELSALGGELAGFGPAGSNAFAASRARSSTGGALLMGEFHMEVGRNPPLLYAAHLELDGGAYLSGMTIPGLPWFAAGRTEHVGWSYTYAHADNVDVVVERVEQGRCLVDGRYEPLTPREEHVRLKGGKRETWLFHDSAYGTVLGDVSGEGRRACVRVSGLDQTYRAFSAAARILDCRNVDDLCEVQREILSVSLEGILADSAGDIASIVTGRIDARPADWSGLYPAARARLGSEPPEPVSEDLRPVSLRPEIGVLASANQGGQGPFKDLWCTLPEPHYRFERITELLGARRQHDLGSLLAISYDTFDASARRLLAVWQPLLPDHPLARSLALWVGEQSDRDLLALFHKLHEEAMIELVAEDVGRDVAERLRDESLLGLYQEYFDAVLALERPALLDARALGRLLERAFARAVIGFESHSVPVRLRFKHIVTQGRSPAALGFDSRKVELPGTPVSVFQARACPIAGQTFVYAPAFHVLFDMSRRGVWYNIPGGASESRRGPGYGKGLDEWLEGELLPLGHPGDGGPQASERLRVPRTR
jgi:penicillin G amidase